MAGRFHGAIPRRTEPINVHGFRSTFRVGRRVLDLSTTYPREVVEAALSHAIKDKAEAAYARTDLLYRRRPLMQVSADHCITMAVPPR